ncbi:acyl oxidase protein [Arthroderma uncinatum]|uniref:acyl oxidase protein n=1 Tax=Arthroderma uncinatum TaxID=74035 RepID=UPI00144AE456|nr:acyl oxidase protein [Arthroderma uncinatum]KAF3482061.1 acyl oxidase protein [Arthroderma uncinatum]
MSHLIDRCGAQGLFAHNQFIDLQNLIRWQSIAEGDVLALGIRLATELLLGRYEMPSATDPSCLLAKHELGLISEARKQLQTFKGGHRSADYNNYLLPRCRTIVEAIGHRIAYEAARDAGLPQDILNLYEASAIESDMSWYVENQEITRMRHFEMENTAMNSLIPRLDTLLEETGAAQHCTAPIVSQEKWAKFVEDLPVISGNAEYDLGIGPVVVTTKGKIDETQSCLGLRVLWRKFQRLRRAFISKRSNREEPVQSKVDVK